MLIISIPLDVTFIKVYVVFQLGLYFPSLFCNPLCPRAVCKSIFGNYQASIFTVNQRLAKIARTVFKAINHDYACISITTLPDFSKH